MARVAAYWPVVLILGVVGFIGWQQHTISSLRAEVRAVGLRADSLEVELDTTRLVGNQYRRRALQAELEQDSLARELQERPVVETTVVLDAAPRVDTVEVTTSGDTLLTSTFEDSLVIAEVAFRMIPPDDWIAEWEIDVKPIRATVGVRCGPVSPTTGVRPVQVTVEVEPWDVEITDPQVDPEVCNPPPPPEDRSFWKGVGTGALAIIGIALIF